VADYIIQKAVNVDAVKKTHCRSLEEYAATFEAQHKYDGCCGVITLRPNGETLCQSRTGEVYPSLDLRASELAYSLREEIRLYRGLVLIGEAWWPGKDQFSAISGEFRRLVPSAKLQFIINDVLTVAEFEEGHSPLPYRVRMDRITGPSWESFPAHIDTAVRQPPASYGCPQAYCNRLVDEGGYDGLILRDPSGTWTRGRGTTGEIVKIKRVLSYDLRVLEVNTVAGEKTGRPVHKLVVDFNGKRLGVGSGVPHKLAEVPTVDQIVEIEAMDLSSEGLLREPRFKGIRFDKLEADAA
jgi:DNA ligase-1